MTYATDQLFEEIAYVAYHFGWSMEEIMELEHADRRAFAQQISAINRRLIEEES